MSTGDRIPLWMGQQAAATVMRAWKMATPACVVVGSVRRQRPDIGDVELIAPAAESPRKDTLFEAIEDTLSGDGGLGMFGTEQERFVEPVRGLKRGFLACSLVATLRGQDGRDYRIPVQVFRYTPKNRGWIELMRTGPGDFGQHFLVLWKQRKRIPWERQASVDGHLVDRDGTIVAVDSELACFAACGLGYIEPKDRDAWIGRVVR